MRLRWPWRDADRAMACDIQLLFIHCPHPMYAMHALLEAATVELATPLKFILSDPVLDLLRREDILGIGPSITQFWGLPVEFLPSQMYTVALLQDGRDGIVMAQALDWEWLEAPFTFIKLEEVPYGPCMAM